MTAATISPATLADIPQLCELLAMLFSLEVDFEPDAVKQSAALQQIIEQPAAGGILVLHRDGVAIGMVNLLFTISTACGGKVGLIEDMILHPLHRNNGLGSKLLQAAIELARNEGCLRLTLLTDRSNDAAVRFYQRQGFDASGMQPLRLDLPATHSQPGKSSS